MTESVKLTDEQFKYIKTTVKVDLHPIFGMHLRAKTLTEVLSDPYSENLDLVKIRRSCGMTKGGFIRESCTAARYLMYTSRYFKDRLHIVTHRIIYMLYHNINLEPYQLINHIDGNTFNNHISNLEVVTAKENSHISKTKNRQKNLVVTKECDSNGIFKIIFDSNKCFGTTKDKVLAENIQVLLNNCRCIGADIDPFLDRFILDTKYKTLEYRLSILNISISSTPDDLYQSIKNFNIESINSLVKQSGVRQSGNKYRVSIRVDGSTINFGTYASITQANITALNVRRLKDNNLTKLVTIINDKPKDIEASIYYSEESLWI